MFPANPCPPNRPTLLIREMYSAEIHEVEMTGLREPFTLATAIEHAKWTGTQSGFRRALEHAGYVETNRHGAHPVWIWPR